MPIGLIIQSLKMYLFSVYHILVIVLGARNIKGRRKTHIMCSLGTGISCGRRQSSDNYYNKYKITNVTVASKLPSASQLGVILLLPGDYWQCLETF